MHFERLVIEAGRTSFSLELHRHLTVIGGVGPVEREGLINEMVGSLGPGRPGVHLELASDAGTRYALFRPVGGRPCVVDIDREADVTEAFLAHDGNVNLLERAGMTVRSASRQMRLTEADLLTRSTMEEYLLSLAHVDQGRLWDVARKVQHRQALLDEAAAEAGSTAEDAAAVEAIETRHREFEEAQERHERFRHLWFMIGGIAAIAVVPVAAAVGPLAAVPLALAALAMTVVSFRAWRRLEEARLREEAALAEAGAHSYLTFQINRVNGLLADDQRRKAMMQAAEFHRAAVVEWELLAGEIPVEWALAHETEVREAATRIRDTIGGPSNPMAVRLNEVEEATADVAHALLHRLDQMRTLGAGGESFPIFLDDPLAELVPEAKPNLLDLLVRASANQQVIYLTEDADVIEWARLEALSGALSLVEPSAPAESAPTGDDDRPRSSRHVAA